MRGSGKRNQTKSADMKQMKDFIRKFVSYESSRNSNAVNKKCLRPRLTFRKFYQLYLEDCVFKQRPKTISETSFRKVVHSEFNLRLFQPQSKQTCVTCKNSRANNENSEVTKHIQIAKSVKNDLIDSVQWAQMPVAKTEVFAFKLQQAIDLPHISDSDSFMKQQLWLNILTVHDELRNISYFYVWDESVAFRGSNEISSCLYRHFLNHLPKDVQKVILFSDLSYGQTRNIRISLMPKKFFDYSNRSELSTIEQHFFTPEHCFNSCDRSFQTVKSNIKLDNIFVPQNAIEVIIAAKKSDPKFNVMVMESRNFFSSAPIEKLLLSTTNASDGQKIRWSDYQKIIFDKEKPFSMNVVQYGETSSKTIEFHSKHSQQQFHVTKLCYISISIGISTSKYEDLQALLKHVPEQYHEFYRSLKHSENGSSNDYVLSMRQSSDEE